MFLSKIPTDHESVQHQVVSSPFPHFVNSPAELPVLDLPDEEEPVMEGDLDSLALSPPPGPGLLSELVHHVRQEGAQVIIIIIIIII